MNNTLIIVSGMAAADKTTFTEWLSQRICAPLLSLDALWDAYGTDAIPFALYQNQYENMLKHSSPLIIAFGFGNEQKQTLHKLVTTYAYHTIRRRSPC